MDFLEDIVLGNPIKQWLVAVGIVLFGVALLYALRSIVLGRLQKIAAKTTTDFSDIVVRMLRKTHFFFFLILVLYVATFFLTLPENVVGIIEKVVIVVILLQGARWGNATIAYWVDRTTKKRMQEDASSATTMSALGFVGKLALWAVVLLLTLDNLGINITALVASATVGGIAVALAVQNILGDLFASLSIVLDKPFVMGDFVIVDQYLGTVEHIGLKTTRIRSLSGEQIVFANSDLLNSRIRNYKRMFERRIVFTFGVPYQTPTGKLEAIPGMVKSILESQNEVRFDRAHFKEFGDFSLNFEVVYYVKQADYNLYMNIQQAVNLELCRKFEEQGIEFAYPTQTLFVNQQSRDSVR